jgi:hypothetical protein
LAPVPEVPARETPAFFEVFDQNRFLTEEHQFTSEEEEYITTYNYQEEILITMETRLKTLRAAEDDEGPKKEVIERLWADQYRYTRSHALRGVIRTYYSSVGTPAIRLSFPPHHAAIEGGVPYDSGSFMGSNSALTDVFINAGDRVEYTTNSQGKVLTEVRMNGEGEVLTEIQNTWSGDRLASVSWIIGDDEGHTEYEYDKNGDRIGEKNYRNQILERTVHKEGEIDVEELYINGKPVLRARWENGRKLSEERINSRDRISSLGKTK